MLTVAILRAGWAWLMVPAAQKAARERSVRMVLLM
jgi:hypothetical protein